jgi:cell division septum initiation protein DivIVA
MTEEKITLEGLTLEELIDTLQRELELLVEENTRLLDRNLQMQDEIDSLWAMMDAMTNAEKEAWLEVLDDLDTDTAVKAMMVTKKKADC